MAQNGSCSVVLDHVGTNNSEEHRLASLVYGCIMCLLIVATLMIWFPRRKHPYLRSRNLQIVAVSSLGFFMEVLANAFVRADPTMPCELVVFCFYNAGVFLVSAPKQSLSRLCHLLAENLVGVASNRPALAETQHNKILSTLCKEIFERVY